MDSFDKLFSSKFSLLKAPFEDRFEFLMNTDVENVTELQNLWGI